MGFALQERLWYWRPKTATQRCQSSESPGRGSGDSVTPGRPFLPGRALLAVRERPRPSSVDRAFSPHLRLQSQEPLTTPLSRSSPIPNPNSTTPPLPETSLLSKGGGKPWAFRSDWSPPAARG